MTDDFSLLDYYRMTSRPDVLMCYRGPISITILNEMSSDITDRFADNVSLKKKLFSIYVELVQNILHYSSEKINVKNRRDSVGTILLTQKEDVYLFSCGNLVENQYVDEIIESCQQINQMDRETLRQIKREKRNSPNPRPRSKGAGIGLIQVALTSGNPLKAEYKKIDDRHSFFYIVATVPKHKKPGMLSPSVN